MTSREDLLSPVTKAPDDPRREPEPGMALCLSGGGYRAMVFHVGVVWRLYEARLLEPLKRISSVSGGSITAGVLALNWGKLDFDPPSNESFVRTLVTPVRKLASKTIDANAIIGGGLLPGSIGERVASEYRKHLFGKATLQDLPDGGPRFVFNATNVQSGALWRFSKPYMGDWRVGRVMQPKTDLATAVAASSAFPPVLSPVSLELRNSMFEQASGTDLQRPPFTTEVVLSDGGVYDNLGLETAYKRYETILVSDAGGKLAAEEEPKRDWARHSYRILNLIDNQVRSLRRRQLIQSYLDGTKKGAYWGIRTNIADYKLTPVLPCPHPQTLLLASLPTRLKRLDDVTQERLINWGYAVCDAALRKHVDQALPLGKFPYPRGV